MKKEKLMLRWSITNPCFSLFMIPNYIVGQILFHATINIEWEIRDVVVTMIKISKVVLTLRGDTIEEFISWFRWVLHSHQALTTHTYHITRIPFSLVIPLPTNYLSFKTNRACQHHH